MYVGVATLVLIKLSKLFTQIQNNVKFRNQFVMFTAEVETGMHLVHKAETIVSSENGTIDKRLNWAVHLHLLTPPLGW